MKADATRWVSKVARGPVRHQKAAFSSGPNLIGPSDPLSNIRPIKRRDPRNDAEKALHELEKDVWKFNHHFWSEHNSKFDECKALFIEKTLLERRQLGMDEPVQKLTANELSVFYKQFLNESYRDQTAYFRRWLRHNVALTWQSLKMHLYNLLKWQK